jgi:hypothetical protein
MKEFIDVQLTTAFYQKRMPGRDPAWDEFKKEGVCLAFNQIRREIYLNQHLKLSQNKTR